MIKNFSFKKLGIAFFIFSILFSNSLFISYAQDKNDIFGEQAVRSLEGLSDPQRGIMTCDPYSNATCTPKDAVNFIKKLGQVSLYIIIIALFVMLVVGGLGYVFYGKTPAFLNKWKKYLRNSITALLIIVGVIGLVLAILSATNFNSQLLEFLKTIFAQVDFSLFNHAYAQPVPVPPTQGGNYADFFPGETVGSLILKIMKVLINYVVAPGLVLATVWAGFLFVKAEGNPQKLTEAKKFALRVVVGIVVATAASLIFTVILNSLNKVSEKTNSQPETTQQQEETP